VTFDRAPESVWSALTEPGRMSAWFGADVELDLRPGGRALFRWADGTSRGATIDVVDPGRYVVLRWLPFEHLSDGRTVPRRSATIELIVTPVGDSTRLTISESDLDHAHAHPLATDARNRTPGAWTKTGP
jgi:uncharacterized protein YndB with AHSA1/START domain